MNVKMIKVSERAHRRLKIYAAKQDKTMTQVVDELSKCLTV